MKEPAKDNSKAFFRRYKPYPAYKDSGVEWLGEVPKHWGIQRMRYTVSSCQNGTWGEEPLGDSGDVTCIRVADFDRTKNKITVLSEPTFRYIPQHQQEKFILNSGELLIEKSGGGEQQPVGVVMLYDLEDRAVCSNFIARMRVKTNKNAIFLLYLHKHLYESGLNTRSIKQNTGIQNLDLKSYLSEYVVMPSFTEQCKIAALLDRETAKIDALIFKQERLIELLQEKRAALITHAVTKGLDPNVPMKDSCVEWLGEIPAHWSLTRLSYVTECLDYKRVPLNAEERGKMQGDYPYWGANSIVDYVNDWLFDEELVLLGEDGAPFFESFKPVSFFVSGKVWVNNHIHVLRTGENVSTEFLSNVLNSVDYRKFIDGATRDKLTQGDMKSIPVQLPPIDEQQQINKRINLETSVMDDIKSKIMVGTTLLREYRSALISAAVTGKIDVREEVSSA